jgi:hypothetical protein
MSKFNSNLIPVHKKKQHIASFSEDEFRDKFLRPLLLEKGLIHGRDTCGTDEEGKDCYFWQNDPIRGRLLVAVQTKKGNINLSSSASTNLINAEAQLRTALATDVYDSFTKQRVKPAYVILAASGSINSAARRHIVDNIGDTRIAFNDADDIIPDIDKLIPEIWNGIDAKQLPYLRKLREWLHKESVTIDISAIGIDGNCDSPISDSSFASIFLHRFRPVTEKHGPDKIDKLEVEEVSLESLIEARSRLILLTGEAGSGKSTSLFRLALRLVDNCLSATKHAYLPIVLTARTVEQSTSPLESLASDKTRQMVSDNCPAFTVEDLLEGQTVFLIDGLDELADENQRKKVLESIKAFHNTYPRVQIILTSRDYFFVNDVLAGYRFERYRITPVSFKQAEKMIARIAKGQSLSSEETEETLRRLENIHGLQLNPLLITVFVATSDYSRSDIPANITEIFKKFTEVMLGRWAVTKGLSQQYQAPFKDFLLKRVGFELHSSGRTKMSIFECKDIISRDLRERDHDADIESLFNEIVFRSGLMKCSGDDVFFVHHLLQEFFAGRGIPSKEFLSSVVSDIWWTKAIVFHFGENPADSQGLIAIREGLKRNVGADEFQAAVAVGLATQACYLMKSPEKISAIDWVIETLAVVKPSILHERQGLDEHYEVLPFLNYYLYGRDAVATKITGQVFEDVIKKAGDISKANELQMFWCLAGMIEARRFDDVLAHIRKFNPKDPKYLLALQMGAMYVQKIHVVSKDIRKKAEEIVKILEPKVSFLKPMVIKELKSLLVEVRDGRVHRIE